MKKGPHLLAFVLFFIAAVTPALAQAASTPPVCGGIEAVIVHGNGVLTKFTGAVHSVEALRRALQGVLSADEFEKLGFNIAYNPTGGFLADILEAAIQDVTTDISQLWRYLNNLLPMPEALQNLIEEGIAGLDESALVNTDSLARHVALYRTAILEGQKVLLVAHSQGTFYANQAYALLSSEERKSFGLVSIALMDSFIAGTASAYITLLEDLVVLAVAVAKARVGLPGPLPPTTTNLLVSSDLLGHSFVDAYLLPNSSSRAAILSQIVQILNTIERPADEAQEGIITVTLTWGAEPDVDLHVFEPNGTHVYYANRFGPSGFLDVDDVTSFGPEHYFVSCDTLEAGTYAVGVNYFRGSAPENAHVQIKAGLLVRDFDIFLPSARGSSGDSSPIPVANIVVFGDAEEGFRFEIE
jgi:hypothetical protein